MTTPTIPDLPLVTDPLTDALHYLRMDGVFYCRSELSAPWGLALPPMPNCLWFHVVTEGTCRLIDSGGSTTELRRGQVAVLPRGVGHTLVDEPGSEAPSVFDLPHDYISRQYAVLRHGGGGAPVDLVCGVVRFGHPSAVPLIDVLPEIIAIDPAAPGTDSWHWLPALLGLMAGETREPRPGSEAVVTRLCDILVIQAIRSWLDSEHSDEAGWISALRDPQIGRAVAAIHRSPGRDWTVAALAAEVAMSRSAFSARFTELVGESAMHYVTRWRMQVAVDLLREQQLTNAEVAARLGYGSEASFCRAFKRSVGVPPGAIKRAASTDLREGLASARG